MYYNTTSSKSKISGKVDKKDTKDSQMTLEIVTKDNWGGKSQ